MLNYLSIKGNVKVIEERHRSDKPSRDYIKVRFLGKVKKQFKLVIYLRVDLPNAMNLLTRKIRN